MRSWDWGAKNSFLQLTLVAETRESDLIVWFQNESIFTQNSKTIKQIQL